MTREEAHSVFRRWMGAEYDTGALDAVAAAVVVERLDGDPLWLLVVSGAGAGKTETVSAAVGAGALAVSTLTGEAALLSATSRKEVAKDATGGLLREIGERGVLVLKDFTSILSMNRDRRGEVLGALREVYDGAWTRKVGVDGGRSIPWAGRIAVVGATTTAYDAAHSVISQMGDRFALVRIGSGADSPRRAYGRQALLNVGHEVNMRSELADAFGRWVAGAQPERAALRPDVADRILNAADLVTLARSAVERDYRGQVEWAHDPEAPTRFAKMLGQVVRGMLALGAEWDEALALMVRVARDTMPPLRLEILEAVQRAPGATCSQVTKAVQKPRTTVDRALQELHLLGLLTVDDGGPGGSGWRYQIAEGVDLAAIAPQVHPEMSFLTRRAQKRSSESLSPCLDVSGEVIRQGCSPEPPEPPEPPEAPDQRISIKQPRCECGNPLHSGTCYRCKAEGRSA